MVYKNSQTSETFSPFFSFFYIHFTKQISNFFSIFLNSVVNIRYCSFFLFLFLHVFWSCNVLNSALVFSCLRFSPVLNPHPPGIPLPPRISLRYVIYIFNRIPPPSSRFQYFIQSIKFKTRGSVFLDFNNNINK